MTIRALKYIDSCMEEMNIPYEFLIWNGDTAFPFFIGEYSETESLTEDGKNSSTFILTGFAEDILSLENIKKKIKSYFTDEGRTAILDDGTGIAVSYSASYLVPTGEQGLYKIQINLNVTEWSC